MSPTNSFLTVLNAFAACFHFDSGLKTSRYVLILSLLQNSDFNTYFSTLDFDFP